MNSEHQLDSLLKQVAEAHRPELPSPDLIWWRAQILRKQEQRERIERPIVVMRRVAIVACAFACVALLAAYWQSFQAMVGRGTWALLPLGIAALAVFLVSTIVLFRSPAKG
jgi:uncharacterized membrane protein